MDGPGGGRGPGQQSGDSDAPPDGHARSFLGGRGHGPLHHGPAPGYHVESLVAVAPASGDEVRGTPQDVVLEGAVRLEPGRQFGQLSRHYLVKARQERVEQTELIHPPSIPLRPSRLRICRGRLSVALETRHLVPVGGQEHGQPHTDHPTADQSHISH